MSKNVAVFVDVANIFYAAKAAGVDIDYVTLLKAATANRDFVRAYAYTGLDPENENQRQFHSFLARSGYKVISKDIRKYGDGRIKANLDIELVVDMMKTARNLDIAVVVSGDGDFAPAIRAVQEMGVRCEVISFRGNTSSDLIDVADQFTDIAQIARVEKGSARSGRRVAAEGDLSMTEVPEKETEGAPRRRRSTRARDGQPAAEVVEVAEPTNIIVLPGERLSRAPDEGEEGEPTGDEAAYAEAADGREPGAEDGRRRRRRRGGRGRGRGGRQPEDGLPVEAGAAAGATGDDEEFEDAPLTQLPRHTFGSVWDSQLGVPSTSLPSAPMTASLSEGGEEEDLDEPEVPEYLLAERRQRGQRGPARGRGAPRGRASYQAALDRERYGRSAAPQPSYGTGRQDRGGSRDRGGRPQGGRPTSRPPRSDDRSMATEPRTSSEPWSEVPPELEEMLRAELARKQPGAPMAPATAPASTSTTAVSVIDDVFEEVAVTDFGATAPSEPAAAETKPARKPRTSKSTAEAKTASTAEAGEPAEPAKPATRSRTTTAKTTTSRSSTSKSAAAKSTKAVAEEPPAEAVAEEPAPQAPAAKPTRRRTTKATPES